MSLAIAQVERLYAPAADLLRLCAFLHPATIPEALLINENVPAELAPAARVTDRYELNQALGMLLMFSLIWRNAAEQSLSVHRLVQVVLRDGLAEQDQRALAIRERVLGLEHPETAVTLGNLALTSYFQNQYDKAEPLAERALATQELVFGRGHPETAQSIMILAMLCLRRADYQRAETLAEEALAVRERILRPQAPDLITSLNNLALIYRAQKKYEQARPLFQRALLLSAQVHGQEHAYTLRVRNNLVSLPQQVNAPAEDDIAPG